MKNNKGIAPLIVILIIAGILALGGGGYYIAQKYKAPVVQQEIAQNQTSTQPAQDETAGWKTYTNDKYGFEVKYPAEYETYQAGNVIHFPKSNSETNWGITISINALGINELCDSAQYAANQKMSTAGDSITSSKVFLNGISQEVSQLRASYNNRAALSTYIPVKDCSTSKKMIVISASEDLLTQYNEFLRTFKFTPTSTQSAQDETASWKTYSNARYSYTIKYPTNWYIDTTNSENDFRQRGPAGNSDFIGGDTNFANYPNASSYGIENIAPKDLFFVSFMIYKITPDITYDQFISSKHFGYNKKENIAINGVSAIKLTGFPYPADNPELTVVNILVKVENKMFVFNYSGKPIPQQMKDIAEKIINSFVQTNSTTQTSNWTTIKSTRGGFSFKVPSEFEQLPIQPYLIEQGIDNQLSIGDKYYQSIGVIGNNTTDWSINSGFSGSGCSIASYGANGFVTSTDIINIMNATFYKVVEIEGCGAGRCGSTEWYVEPLTSSTCRFVRFNHRWSNGFGGYDWSTEQKQQAADNNSKIDNNIKNIIPLIINTIQVSSSY